MSTEHSKHYSGRWLAGMTSFPSARGEVVLALVMEDGEEPMLRAAGRWLPARDMVPDLGDVMDRAVREPLEGRPHLPAIVRVATEELAASIQDARPEIRVEIGPTTALELELKRVARELDDDETWQWLGGEIDAAAVEKLFAAARAFEEVEAWEVFGDEQFARVALPGLELREVAVMVSAEQSVTGNAVLSVAIAPGRAALDAWRDDMVPPDQIDVYFFERDDLSDAAWGEAKAHGWQSTGLDLYPRVVTGGEDERPTTAREMTIATAVLDALSAAMRTEPESDVEGVVQLEVTLATGDLARVRLDPLDVIESQEDDDDDFDGPDVDEDELEKWMAEDEAFLALDDEDPWKPAPKAANATVRNAPKPGRNDECWCGSGKKYKKCHLEEDEAKARG